MTELTAATRDRLACVADLLIPAGSGLPSATEAGVHTDLLDQVADVRPDLIAPLSKALDALGAAPDLATVDRLAVEEPHLHDALALVVAGGYLMSRRVANLLRYPFQEARLVDPRDISLVVHEGLLDPVAERDPFYRVPPDGPPRPTS